jgi:hypothetical protein
VLGDDGWYHLHLANMPRCADRSLRRALDDRLWHAQWCHWWTDGTRYRVQAPPEAWHVNDLRLIRGERGERTVRWAVTLTDVIADPAQIPLRQACPDQGVRIDWPGYQGSDTATGRLHARLVDFLGPHSHACRMRPGAVVDHDHFTGLVRGDGVMG